MAITSTFTDDTPYTTAESNYAQTVRGLGIRRNQDALDSRTFDKLGNFTSLSKADVSVPSYVENTFARGTFTARKTGFAQTELRRDPGDTALASARPLDGITKVVADGGLRKYSLITTYDLKETQQGGFAAKWMDIYGRVLEVAAGNIAILNDKAANAESTLTEFNPDKSPGNETYVKNKGLTYYTKYTGGNKSIGGVEVFSVGKE
jgi:hypothetical protein